VTAVAHRGPRPRLLAALGLAPRLLSLIGLPLLLMACTTHPAVRPAGPSPPPASPTQAAAGTAVPELAAVIKAAADKSEHESNAAARGQLAAQASQAADACMAQAPAAAACLYGRAVASGLEARAHPMHVNELLKIMLENLGRAETAQADYDEAGPARVRALVLLKAPPWPLGPGDAAEGLKAAQRASALRPDYPPNQLVLAQAQAKNGDQDAARASYARARQLAMARPASAERDDWVHEAEAGQ
jgi:hypothetical protein